MAARIVICDDQIHIQKAVEFALRRRGYEVSACRDGEEAWEVLQEGGYHLLVTDMQMPRLNGIQLIHRMRENPQLRDLPVVLLTAKGFELDVDGAAAQYGKLTTMIKPFSPLELGSVVAELLAAECSSV